MKRNGLTLIELLAVIILLAVIVIIATPVIINVVDEAKDKADKNSVYGYLEAAQLYYYDAQLNEDKKQDLETLQNLYDKVIIKGTKPEKGELYATMNGTFAVAVELRDKCYYKDFDTELEVRKEYDTCTLGWVGPDTENPTLEMTYEGTVGSNDWYTSSVWVHVTVSDQESGPSNIAWCKGVDCEPVLEINNTKTIQKDILLSEDGNTTICAIGYDKQGNASEKKCSKEIKIDTQAPEFSGIEDLTVMKDTVVDLRNGVTVRDNLSGIVGDFTTTPDTVDTFIAKMIEVTYTVKDQAGNEKQITRKVIIDALAPTVTFTPETGKINSNGWAKEDFYVNIGINDQSETGIKDFYICTGNTSDTCDPKSGSHITEGTNASRVINVQHNNNRICVQASDNNNKTSDVICSDAYKLDKTPPTAGTATFTGTLGSNSWYTSNVTVNVVNGSDSLSSHGSTVSNISSITSNTSGTTVIITTADQAGNTASRSYTIKVDKNAPTLTVKSTATETITVGTNITVSNYFNAPSYSISGGTLSCSPVNTLGLAVGTHTVSCTATGNNGKRTTVNKTVIVKTNTYLYYTTARSGYKQQMELRKCDIDGSNCSTIQNINGSDLYAGITPTIALGPEYVYYTDYNYDNFIVRMSLYRCTKEGNDCQELQYVYGSGLGSNRMKFSIPPMMAANSSYLYFTTQDVGDTLFKMSLYRCATNGTNCTDIASLLGVVMGSDTKYNPVLKPVLAANDRYLYYTTHDTTNTTQMTLYRCDITGANCGNLLIMNGINFDTSSSYDVDGINPMVVVNNEYLYYTTHEKSGNFNMSLYRCDLDGNNCVEITTLYGRGSAGSGGTNGVMYPTLALNNSYLYYTTNETNSFTKMSLYRCQTNGSNCIQLDTLIASQYGNSYTGMALNPMLATSGS